MGIRTLAELRAQDPAALEAAFGPRQGRWLHRRARLEDETPVDRRARPSRSRPRPPSTSTSPTGPRWRRHVAAARRGALPAPAQARAGGAHDRDQGPARRLDQRQPLAHGRGADQRPGRRRPRRPRPAARLRPAPAGAAARRAGRRLRGRRRGPNRSRRERRSSSSSASPPDPAQRVVDYARTVCTNAHAAHLPLCAKISSRER